MEPLDPPEAPEPPRPDPVERISLLVAAGVLVLLLFWSIDGLRTLELAPAEQFAWGAVAVGAGLAWFALLAALLSPHPLERLGLVPATLHTIVWGALGIATLSHGLDAALAGLAPQGSPGVEAAREALAEIPRQQLPFVLAAVAGMTPLGEELFFRGLLQRGIAQRGYPVAAIAGAALLFGAAHGGWIYGGAAFVLGVGMGLLVHWSGSLLPALAAHAANNAIAVVEASGRLEVPAPLAEPLLGSVLGLGGGALLLWWALVGGRARAGTSEL